jgi:hypothetical protein
LEYWRLLRALNRQGVGFLDFRQLASSTRFLKSYVLALLGSISAVPKFFKFKYRNPWASGAPRTVHNKASDFSNTTPGARRRLIARPQKQEVEVAQWRSGVYFALPPAQGPDGRGHAPCFEGPRSALSSGVGARAISGARPESRIARGRVACIYVCETHTPTIYIAPQECTPRRAPPYPPPVRQWLYNRRPRTLFTYTERW